MLEKRTRQNSKTAVPKLPKLKILYWNPNLFEVNPSCVHPAFLTFLLI